jgi:hypothetical protein
VSVTGVVQLVLFTNPHVHIVIEAPMDAPPPPAPELAAEAAQAAPLENGVVEVVAPTQPESPETILYVLDLPAPNRAQQIGLTPETLPPGTPLSVVAWPPRAMGSHDLAPLTITFDGDGHSVRIR